MVGLPNHKVIPDGWSEHHRATMVGTMTGVCDVLESLTPGNMPGLDGAGVSGGSRPVQHGDVPCRVQQLGGGDTRSATGKESRRRDYLVTLPIEKVIDLVAGDEGNLIRVTEADDPEAVGRILTIEQILYGSLAWERDILCRDDLGQNRKG